MAIGDIEGKFFGGYRTMYEKIKRFYHREGDDECIGIICGLDLRI